MNYKSPEEDPPAPPLAGPAGKAGDERDQAVSLIAGVVVAAAPVSSVTVLAVLIGIWFIATGHCCVVPFLGSVGEWSAFSAGQMVAARL